MTCRVSVIMDLQPQKVDSRDCERGQVLWVLYHVVLYGLQLEAGCLMCGMGLAPRRKGPEMGEDSTGVMEKGRPTSQFMDLLRLVPWNQ